MLLFENNFSVVLTTPLELYLVLCYVYRSVADPHPGPCAFLPPGSGIRNRFLPDPGSPTHIFEFFRYNVLKLFVNWLISFSVPVKIILNSLKFVATKKNRQQMFPPFLLLLFDPKWIKIRDKHLRSATLVYRYLHTRVGTECIMQY